MDAIFNSIDANCELTIASFHHSFDKGDYYYLSEQSPLQVLRELPDDTNIKVISFFSERDDVFKQADSIKAVKTIRQFFDIILPLVEKEHYLCKDVTIGIDNQIELSGHDDGEVHLGSKNNCLLKDLVSQIMVRQRYNKKLLNDIIKKPGLYHKLERPSKILSSYSTFEELHS